METLGNLLAVYGIFLAFAFVGAGVWIYFGIRRAEREAGAERDLLEGFVELPAHPAAEFKAGAQVYWNAAEGHIAPRSAQEEPGRPAAENPRPAPAVPCGTCGEPLRPFRLECDSCGSPTPF